jgi:hypothetical protein
MYWGELGKLGNFFLALSLVQCKKHGKITLHTTGGVIGGKSLTILELQRCTPDWCAFAKYLPQPDRLARNAKIPA